ncbi:uncharacterized protein LOC124357515 isoform X2 [Homalodisca vitripennis]|uniref:uncharacterized protein LOC124357515 isoform X2 n=1 Tax=Homalodisca vitripennis TaxID=197043 RepID=UPI001EEC2936|nr:uncharacterized protein LOC124357515 isoform X2 [Homalodisca vitripennis]
MTEWQWLAYQLLFCYLGVAYGEYLGCYRETDPHLMNGHQQNFVVTLTPDRCLELCSNKGFQYAGLKSRVTCFCDNNEPSLGHKTEESQCQTTCVGDDSKICGGEEALSVFTTNRAVEDVVEPISHNYVGCYKDNNDDRLLTGYKQELVNNSPERCRALCYRRGYLYSGVEFGVECFCGDAHPPPPLLRADYQCSMACPDSSTQKCGGSGMISIYDTGITDIRELGMKVNCFNDEDPRILQAYKIDLETTNSPRRCMNLCRSLGYDYSGVEYGKECFCDNDVHTKSIRDAPDEVCNTTCSGDVFQNCGGNWRLIVYRTGLSDPGPVPKRVGCLEVTASDTSVMDSYRQGYRVTTTSDNCAKLCYNKGFYFSTLVTSTECWCDNKTPPQTQSVGEEDCEENLAVVYNTGYTINNHPGGNDDYIGCFRSYSTTPLGGFHKKFETQLTPEKCTELCFKKGYLYSGTKNNNECHCGDNRLSENKVGDDGCSSPCSGDTKKRCGGIGKLSLYSTGITDVSATGKLIGCFIDETLPRVLDQYKTDLDNTNSPRRCLNYCLALGYLFAGVEYQRECFCGNTRPSSSLNSPDSECNSICSGDSSEICGGNWRIAVYRTGNGDSVSPPDKVSPCEPSVTLMNGKPACRGATLFIDTFSNSTLHPHWKHEIKIADTPDYEFVTFNSLPANSFQRDGKLIIKPVVLSDRDVEQGHIKLNSCTGLANSRECELSAFSYNILPPVRSARIHTRNSFSFRYGIVQIRARLPAGDWIVPELWLMPKDQSYGSSYQSGKVRVAMSRGNRQLTCNGKDMGSSVLESGVLVGTESNVLSHSVLNRISDSWYSHPHNYTLIWTPDNLLFYVDGQPQQALLPPGVRLTELLGFRDDELSAWKTGSRIAPFDTDFYLSMGVSVGGSRDFPDGCINKDRVKPWTNFKLKAMLNFWLDKEHWWPSWGDVKSSMIVEHVQVTAL